MLFSVSFRQECLTCGLFTFPLANARGSDTRQANKSEPRVAESEPRVAHSRQAKANSLRCSFPGSVWEHVLGGSAACSVRRWQSNLGKRSQAEPGNEHRSEFAFSLTAMALTPSRALKGGIRTRQKVGLGQTLN